MLSIIIENQFHILVDHNLNSNNNDNHNHNDNDDMKENYNCLYDNIKLN